MTGYRAFSYLFVKTCPILSNGFEIETEMTIHALDKNMLIDNVVVNYRDRPQGSSSKLNTFRDGIKVLKTILVMLKNYRPLLFFGSISLVLFLAALGLFIPVLSEYTKTGLVLKFPTLIVSGFGAMAALIFLCCGMILNVLKAQSRQQFELTLNQFKKDLFF